MSLRNKRTIYTMHQAGHDIRESSFAHARPDLLYDLQIVQNNFVEEQLTHHERFFDIANSHPNPLLVSAVSYEPPPPQHFCRRPRNVLIDPPDELTAEVEKLIEVNKMAIE
ncbi:hypothetical protein EVAR_52231_1 [Eumeta japonica]|uniref:Uncharacterized protein n=1 Tax=Eumeta variegata TaxID=151549 RepID=A0A4C1Z5U7_EUMVA|nr:hypothetical protein EVAR_52231_1 [Eumeta japonica]